MSSLSAPIRIGFAKISSAWERIDSVRMMLHEGLQRDGFEVVVASNVRDALRLIATETFDVLLSDLHMPLAGDGFTLVSAMRHTHPDALTVVLSGYPALDEAMSANCAQGFGKAGISAAGSDAR